MLQENYRPMDKNDWQGRIDSVINYDAFRWHQWVKPLDLNRDDLEPFEGKVGFAFIGFPSDEGVKRNKGRTGTAKGPESIRKELSHLPCSFSEKVKLFDAGNIICKNRTLEENQKHLGEAVEKILSLNLFPIVLGGGHAVAFGHYKGILSHLRKENEKPNIGIINFDAHFDIRPYPNGGTSGTMFRQIADVCEEEDINYSYMCVGIQKHSNTVDLFKTAEGLGANYILAKDIRNGDSWNLLETIDKFMRTQDHIYMTICADVFSTAYAPGVSATQPLGLEPEKVLNFMKYILKSKKVISFDIAEVSPRFDQDNTTANLAAVLIFSVVNTISKMNNLSI
ncbi:formimidoylglutamase [Anaeromicrobium sediminis]|uniref:Formimidoylglutamase n=1 Tax=Anaeromicrobium sediminis TaxID=1478221 RepID=A0A267MLF2_9FIRM|nr:formimidoylglutamase [Anaeromicrobium sediminis]PAB60257.1 formimidoylglutamase [Anaeromicrobium sediminis]